MRKWPAQTIRLWRTGQCRILGMEPAARRRPPHGCGASIARCRLNRLIRLLDARRSSQRGACKRRRRGLPPIRRRHDAPAGVGAESPSWWRSRFSTLAAATWWLAASRSQPPAAPDAQPVEESGGPSAPTPESEAAPPPSESAAPSSPQEAAPPAQPSPPAAAPAEQRTEPRARTEPGAKRKKPKKKPRESAR